ncbi:hypothetical protein BCR37DRAFT_394192 [Protomyces lactucae-debilis]|uniref:UDP-glucose:Glyco protein glucosyltransferase-domain-containing protein n=1 Tax=Protomyces lactucae-debilis TaxID=2754530 RepID=A0A1Y2F6G1_PROLT|nr:uncharacterized protein BCR37DRAFT_394192 [Protomyces lactucae-debilis]ORY79472.1 hypothetical protein BCR37DRAFT_394192 [Protomyces lactucae-debilis]
MRLIEGCLLLGLGITVDAYQLRASLKGPSGFSPPSLPAEYVETLYHVNRQAYCDLLKDLSTSPVINDKPEAQLANLLKRSHLTDQERGLVKLSLALHEYAPAATFNGTLHNCTANPQRVVYTDFTTPFVYDAETQVGHLPPGAAQEPLTMTGYGAHLALKRTDYLVIDDSNKMSDASDDHKVVPLTKEQIKRIGLRAAARVVRSDNPLDELEDVSQNFPMRAQGLLKSSISKELEQEMKGLRELVRGDVFLINGREVETSPEKLMPALRAEAALASAMHKLGLNLTQIVHLLTLDVVGVDHVDRFEVRNPVVVYLNDLEKDDMYEGWRTDVNIFMEPLMAGQLHQIRRNFHTGVAYIDLTDEMHVDLLTNWMMLITRGIPIRWGFVPAGETELQRNLGNAFREIFKHGGLEQAYEFIAGYTRGGDLEGTYAMFQKKLKGKSLADLADLGSSEYDEFAKDWIERFGKDRIYINGQAVVRDEALMQRLSAAVRDDTMFVQERMIEGGVEDSGDLQDIFLDGAQLRFSEALFGERKYITLHEYQAQPNAGKCSRDTEIVFSGEGWPDLSKMEELAEKPCLSHVDGPRRMIVNGRIFEKLSFLEMPTMMAQEQREVIKYKDAAASVGASWSVALLTLIRTSKRLLRTSLPPFVSTDLSHFEVGREQSSTLEIKVFLDPLSENAQRWSTIIKSLSNLPNVFIKVHMIPKSGLTELPLKRFYRYLMPAEPSFAPVHVDFSGMPSDLMVFTLEPWNSWVIAPVSAIEDLDNLHLGDRSIDAVFEVTHILVQGHAREANTTNPPRGAQLVLSSGDGVSQAETIIMANLGYFQLKAMPGSWQLALKEGKSDEIFELQSSVRTVHVDSWAPSTLYVRLARKPGMEKADVLDDKQTAGKGSLWSKVSNMGKKDTALVKKHADINIFTVASGHLYERFVYIMVSSVMAHTDKSVKFWFISNFLSPQFRKFIPHLAERLGFEYEMITFTWPHWLRKQTEKQRIIWGYKILFLDVMFPLDLEKVIFVDADQIVRTDMIELVNEDLKGKVWGYTPMCDSRKEIEGFRFWKQGYWKSFLRGKPYHISALYVIDLVAFRAQATGDRLRQQYHALSADPESLSNLDQDLPNHLQAQIPIHSLKQDWLWCETWCSDESLATAKTIDLCQNPMTKEPKLDRARRQLPEWNEYDRKVKGFAKLVAEREAAGGQEGDDSMGSITVDVDAVGQNLEMKKDQLGDEAMTGSDGGEKATRKGHDEL